MSTRRFVFLLFSLLFVCYVSSKPAGDVSDSDPLAICYSLNCPSGTTVCGKHSEISSEDKTKLNVQTRCYDEEGNILRSKNSTEDNPFGPNVYYKGTKLSAVVRVIPTDFYGTDNSNEDKVRFVPTYLTYPSYPKPKSGPKSEVEDLNSR